MTTLTPAQVQRRVLDCIAGILEVRPPVHADATLGLRFVEDLGADSLDMAELVMEVEDDLDFCFPDPPPVCVTVRDLVDETARLLRERDEKGQA